ncbi:MAG: hypothetical protein DRQ47_06425 [Gammaproteobacteria bacterium]|nr:MAG: hypothetical protein DRQ47_06425 [Gammaproteobacteria bacterium]
MNKAEQLASYDDLQKLLDANQYLITVAELQGLLMGFYSAGLELDDHSWKKHLMKQLAVSELQPEFVAIQLTEINKALVSMISSEIFGLELLIPDDESPTTTRGEALGYWCQGFLLGYMQVTENKEETDEDVADALEDLEEISNIDLDSIGNTEEDEKSLFEITEHIKVTAQLIHSVNGQAPVDTDETIH